MFPLCIVDMCHLHVQVIVPLAWVVESILYGAFSCGLYVQVWVSGLCAQSEVSCHLSSKGLVYRVSASLPLCVLCGAAGCGMSGCCWGWWFLCCFCLLVCVAVQHLFSFSCVECALWFPCGFPGNFLQHVHAAVPCVVNEHLHGIRRVCYVLRSDISSCLWCLPILEREGYVVFAYVCVSPLHQVAGLAVVIFVSFGAFVVYGTGPPYYGYFLFLFTIEC